MLRRIVLLLLLVAACAACDGAADAFWDMQRTRQTPRNVNLVGVWETGFSDLGPEWMTFQQHPPILHIRPDGTFLVTAAPDVRDVPLRYADWSLLLRPGKGNWKAERDDRGCWNMYFAPAERGRDVALNMEGEGPDYTMYGILSERGDTFGWRRTAASEPPDPSLGPSVAEPDPGPTTAAMQASSDAGDKLITVFLLFVLALFLVVVAILAVLALCVLAIVLAIVAVVMVLAALGGAALAAATVFVATFVGLAQRSLGDGVRMLFAIWGSLAGGAAGLVAAWIVFAVAHPPIPGVVAALTGAVVGVGTGAFAGLGAANAVRRFLTAVAARLRARVGGA